MKTYFLPIKAENLGQYFSKAIICPTRYLDDRMNDIQNKYADFLLLSDKSISIDTDCCLEIVFSPVEYCKEIRENIFLYDRPLPISRVKSIIFKNKEQKETTIGFIELSTAFIPNELIRIEKIEEVHNLNLPEEFNKDSDWTEQIKRFNNRLGGLALMKIVTREGMNYSINYFQTLGMYSKTIESELIKSNKSTKNVYQSLFQKGERDNVFLTSLSKKIGENEIKEMAKIEKQSISKDKLTGIINYNNLNGDTYILSILGNYGVGSEAKNNKIDSLILTNFSTEIKQEKAEEIALCYGINRGYAVFPKQYSIGEKKVNIKYELNSQLDYYTIESVYQYCFNKDMASDEFPYLDKWCPKLPAMDIKDIKRGTYLILDKIIIEKKNPSVFSKEYWDSLLDIFKNDNNNQMYFEIYSKYFESNFKELINKSIKDSMAEKQDEIDTLNDKINNIQKENNNLKDELNFIENSKSAIDIKSFEEPNTIEYANNYTNEEINKDKIIEDFLHIYELKTAEFNKMKKECGIDTKIKDKKEITKKILIYRKTNISLSEELN